jgi:hypothetical protein
MALSDDYNLRDDQPRMTDVADFVDLFGAIDSWTPTITAGGSMGISTTLTLGRYRTIGNLAYIHLRIEGSLSATLSDRILFTLPIAANASLTEQQFHGRVLQPGEYANAAMCYNNSTTQASIFRALSDNYLSGTFEIVINGQYFIA